MSKRRLPQSKSRVSSEVASRIIASASDVTFVVDRAGVIREVFICDPSLKAEADAQLGPKGLVGKRWVDTVTKESRSKVEQLLTESRQGRSTRAREINQTFESVGDVPLRFSGALLDDAGNTVMLARDLRPLAEMQQKLVSAQQALDRDYGRLRQADMRYRVLFHVALEGVLVVDATTHRVLEANPAAAYMLDESAAALQGASLSDLFASGTWPSVQAMLGGIEAGARPNEMAVQLRGQSGREIMLSGVLFRQSGSALVLLRFWAPEASTAPSGVRSTRMLAMLEALPDAVVITGEDRRILGANSAFCELVQKANERQVIGESIDTWLGRPGVDMNIMLSSLREHGSLRDFATVVHADYGMPQDALVTAVSLVDGTQPCIAFTIRRAAAPLAAVSRTPAMPRSMEQLRSLVGRMPLKDLVRESVDLIERMCIEVALDLSGNNRATAAQLLGLSRQGLYSKLRRYGLAEALPE
jgi:transcriptional regulator PpsR